MNEFSSLNDRPQDKDKIESTTNLFCLVFLNSYIRMMALFINKIQDTALPKSKCKNSLSYLLVNLLCTIWWILISLRFRDFL